MTDIQETGQLINRGMAEGKYFSTTAEGATSYAQQAVKAFGDPPYTLVTIEIPRSLLLPEMMADVDGGIQAVILPDHLLALLTPSVEGEMPLLD